MMTPRFPYVCDDVDHFVEGVEPAALRFGIYVMTLTNGIMRNFAARLLALGKMHVVEFTERSPDCGIKDAKAGYREHHETIHPEQ